MSRFFDLFLRIGGYWSRTDAYVGGESHEIGKTNCDFMCLSSLQNLVKNLGYEENMRKVSWFPPNESDKREDIVDNETLLSATLINAQLSGAVTLYIVREDDPYLHRHMEVNDSDSDIDANDTYINVVDDNENDDDCEIDGESENVASVFDDTKYQKFIVGQEYLTKESFKRAVTKYALNERRNIEYAKSESKRVIAVCGQPDCPFRIYASINSRSNRFVIRSLNEEHNCTWQGKVKLLHNAEISDLFIEDFRVNPRLSATQLQKLLRRQNINVPETKCERARLRCLQKLDDEQAESFARFFDYVEELKRSNPGSTVELEVRQTVFYRFYVCFGALKDGWKSACRNIIHLDGTFLKWRMTGQLLTAVGRDPNDQLFPVAWAVVESENKDNWTWFFEHLIHDLDLGSGNGYTLVSDQQKGLIEAVKNVIPYAEHRMCARHIYSNWKKQYAGPEYESCFWAAAESYYMQKFDKHMEELKMISFDAYEALRKSISCHWSRAFFTEFSKCDAIENNSCESWNAAIRKARTKPIVEMLEDIRRSVMISNERKHKEAEKEKMLFTPRSRALLENNIFLTKNCSSLSCGLGNFEVDYFNDRFTVSLRNDVSCSCRMYKLSGIPCCHIISALREYRNGTISPDTLISDWFSAERRKRCYQNLLQPVNGINLWKVTTQIRVKPPLYKRPPGRPPGKQRRREKDEPRPNPEKQSRRGLVSTCSICKQPGHNKTKCQNAAVAKPPTKKIGRPLKRSHEEANDSVSRLSDALPRRKPGRPRKGDISCGSSRQSALKSQIRSHEPIYDNGPTYIPREGYGVFTSPETGDDYVHIGRSVVDTRDNTVLPSTLYMARERMKMSIIRGRGRGRGL